MNRFKKEEKKRGKPFGDGKNLSEEEYNEWINAHEEGREPDFEKARERESKKSKKPN